MKKRFLFGYLLATAGACTLIGDLGASDSGLNVSFEEEEEDYSEDQVYHGAVSLPREDEKPEDKETLLEYLGEEYAFLKTNPQNKDDVRNDMVQNIVYLLIVYSVDPNELSRELKKTMSQRIVVQLINAALVDKKKYDRDQLRNIKDITRQTSADMQGVRDRLDDVATVTENIVAGRHNVHLAVEQMAGLQRALEGVATYIINDDLSEVNDNEDQVSVLNDLPISYWKNLGFDLNGGNWTADRFKELQIATAKNSGNWNTTLKQRLGETVVDELVSLLENSNQPRIAENCYTAIFEKFPDIRPSDRLLDYYGFRKATAGLLFEHLLYVLSMLSLEGVQNGDGLAYKLAITILQLNLRDQQEIFAAFPADNPPAVGDGDDANSQVSGGALSFVGDDAF